MEVSNDIVVPEARGAEGSADHGERKGLGFSPNCAKAHPSIPSVPAHSAPTQPHWVPEPELSERLHGADGISGADYAKGR